MRLLGFLVIALNIPVFLIGWLWIIGGFQDVRLMIMGAFAMLFSASNIVPAFGYVGNPFQTSTPRYRLGFFLNIIAVLFIVTFFSSPFAKVNFISLFILAAAMTSILFLIKLRQAPSRSDHTLAASLDPEPYSEEQAKKNFKTLIRYQKIVGFAFTMGLFGLFLGTLSAYMAFDIGYPFDTPNSMRFIVFLYSLSIISLLIARYFNVLTESKRPGAKLVGSGRF